MKTILILILTVVLFASCKKQTSSPSEPAASFSATIDGIYWQADSVGATRVLYSFGQNYFEITATGKDGKAFYFSTYNDTVSASTFKIGAVSLMYFYAERKEKPSNEINLRWATSSEADSKTFEIERSIDGINWVKAGEVNAAGNSDHEIDYSWSEKPPLTTDHFCPLYYYRLKQIDLDGLFSFSNVKNVGSPFPALFVFPVDDYSYGFNGQINVTAVDKEKKIISGNFHFMYLDDKNQKQLQITNGSFENIPYK